MKTIFTLMLSTVLLLSSVISFADDITGDNYWTVGVNQLTLGEKTSVAGEELDFSMLNFAIGHRFNRFISAEASMSWWILQHHMPGDELSDGTEIALDRANGLGLRFDTPKYKKLSGFANVSFNMVHFDVVGSDNMHDSGLGYAAGLQYEVKGGAIFAKYVVLLDNENDDPDEPSFEDLTGMGIGYKLDMPW